MGFDTVDNGLGCIDGLTVVSGLIGRSFRLRNDIELSLEKFIIVVIFTCILSVEPNVWDLLSSFCSAKWIDLRQLSQTI